MTLAAVVTDLIFSSTITNEAQRQGRAVLVLCSFTVMEVVLRATPPDMVMLDLSCGEINGISAIVKTKILARRCKVLAYMLHAQPDLAQQALAAGADQVVSRTEFIELLPALVKTYAATASGH